MYVTNCSSCVDDRQDVGGVTGDDVARVELADGNPDAVLLLDFLGTRGRRQRQGDDTGRDNPTGNSPFRHGARLRTSAEPVAGRAHLRPPRMSRGYTVPVRSGQDLRAGIAANLPAAAHRGRTEARRLLAARTSGPRAWAVARGTKKKGPAGGGPFHENDPGNVLLSHAVAHAVPSALRGLTTVFGMGTGVTPSLWSPGN